MNYQSFPGISFKKGCVFNFLFLWKVLLANVKLKFTFAKILNELFFYYLFLSLFSSKLCLHYCQYNFKQAFWFFDLLNDLGIYCIHFHACWGICCHVDSLYDIFIVLEQSLYKGSFLYFRWEWVWLHPRNFGFSTINS